MASTITPRTGIRTASPPPREAIPLSVRLSWRKSYGDLPSVLAAADEELRNGSPRNALTGYQFAICHWLRVRFVSLSGKHQSPIFDADRLLEKLLGRGDIDRWTHQLLRDALKQVKNPDRRHVEIVGGIVSALTLEPLRSEEVTPCRA